MDHPVEHGKVVEALFFEDGAEVELDVRLALRERGIAQDSQHLSIRHEAPHRLGAIQVLLNEAVRRQPRPPTRRHPAEPLPYSNYMNGRRKFEDAGLVRDCVYLPINVVTFFGVGLE